jgi:hypothetical protein
MRLALITAWILAGTALTAGVYWAVLNTPESTILAVITSVVLLLAALVLLGVTVNGAIVMWSNGPSRSALRRALWRAPAVVPAVLLVSHAETWVALRQGPINAWFIARFGWGDVSWLFTGIRYGAMWIRWVVAALLAVWVMATLLHGVKFRLSVTRVALATLWFAVLIALPWAYLVPWRPAWLPPTNVELAFSIVKLSVAAGLLAAGAALVIREASPRSATEGADFAQGRS